MKKDRRSFLKMSALAGTGILGVGIRPGIAHMHKAGDPEVADTAAVAETAPLNRFPRMMQEYFVQRLRQIEAVADERRAAVQSKADALAYVKEVREKIRSCLGPWPQKTPLNARVTGIIKRKDYRIEKIIFESRPGFPVTGNLYIPVNRKGRMPAVLGTCGHGDAAKEYPSYQSFAQGLAKQGYVVFIYDPISQGERLQYVSGAKSRFGAGVPEHLQAGSQLLLTGQSLSTWFVWDGIRALDYLLGRPEVNAAHVGVTGNSGGGTQTAWLCAVEDRITMAAPGCFITTFRRNLENENPADNEQCPPGALALGLDHSDFIAAMAPKPAILLSQEKDFFDIRGTEEAYARLKKLYRLLDAEDRVQLHTDTGYHGYSQANREAMYAFFNNIIKQRQQNKEPELQLEPEAALWCTPNGQVAELQTGGIPAVVARISNQLKAARKPLPAAELQKAVANLLQLPTLTGTPEYRILRPMAGRGYPKKQAAVYAVETEPGITSIIYRLEDEPLYSRPHGDAAPALLYISDLSADAELRKEPLLKEWAARKDAVVYTCDVRGAGESQPNTCSGNFLAPAGSDYFYATHSIMLGLPYVGQKTFDVLRVVQWLQASGHRQIHLAGNGRGAVPAAFAALLTDAVTTITLKNAPAGYGVMAEESTHPLPLSQVLPGVLKSFDLQDCYAALQAKQLRSLS
ncbi:acetylxylan esterase [Niabella sp. CC-SYL272]|uniref:alpha/beta hydrolase family protein n=1 Tax=Niabella agricola TaxID=2891571 RepID=UPI001F440B8C|nr:acetylxylan esterase [Niabella agricola]MCF3109878.1 acetylxylan esterase [Niabella agricola]